jgi:tetratricopeptide (TPR) repeat protein
MMDARRERRWAAAVVATVLLGCPPPAMKRAAPIPTPDLSGLEPAVREQLTAGRERLQEFALSDGAAGGDLGAAWGELGRLYHAYAISEPAVVCYREAARLQPDEFSWPYYLGRLLLDLERGEEARGELERALRLRPGDVPTLVAVATLARERGELADAEEYLRRALEAQPQAAGAILELAHVAEGRQDWRAAVGAYQRLLNLQPGATRLWGRRADAYRALGELDKARIVLSRRGEGTVEVEDPMLAELADLRVSSRAFVERGNAAYGRGDYAAAVEAFTRAVELAADDLDARVNLGAALLRARRRDEAREHYRAVLARQQDHPRALFGIGVLLAEEGRLEEARAHYEAALAADPGYRDPRFNLANLLRRQGRLAEAAAQYRALADRDVADEAAWVGEAACLVELARYSEARARLKEGLGLNPTFPLLAQLGARLLAASPDPLVRDAEQALRLATELVEMRPSSAHLETLGMALAAAGRYEEAVRAQEQAIAAATSDGLLAALPRLRDNLERYRRREPAPDPGIG